MQRRRLLLVVQLLILNLPKGVDGLAPALTSQAGFSNPLFLGHHFGGGDPLPAVALAPQERTVIKLYYFEGQTLKEIKAVLRVSESRVSQIHAQAVIHLRAKLRELRLDLGYRDGDPNVKQKYVRKPAANLG